MPISTTFVMTRSPSGSRPSSRFASQTWPMISAAVRLRLKPCGPGRAERAVERAADLARDAKRAATRLGNEDRLDDLFAARGAGHAQQPLARAVGAVLRTDDLRHADLGAPGELPAEILREVGHAREVVTRRDGRSTSGAGGRGRASRRSPATNSSSPARVSPSRLTCSASLFAHGGRPLSASAGRAQVSAKK